MSLCVFCRNAPDPGIKFRPNFLQNKGGKHNDNGRFGSNWSAEHWGRKAGKLLGVLLDGGNRGGPMVSGRGSGAIGRGWALKLRVAT